MHLAMWDLFRYESVLNSKLKAGDALYFGTRTEFAQRQVAPSIELYYMV